MAYSAGSSTVRWHSGWSDAAAGQWQAEKRISDLEQEIRRLKEKLAAVLALREYFKRGAGCYGQGKGSDW